MTREFDWEKDMADAQLVVSKIKTTASDIVKRMTQLDEAESELSKQIKALQAKKKGIEKEKTALKTLLTDAVNFTGAKKIETDQYEFSLKTNGGVQPLKIIGNVPDNYCKMILEPDKTKIRNALTDGIELDFAYLEERGQHLIVEPIASIEDKDTKKIEW